MRKKISLFLTVLLLLGTGCGLRRLPGPEGPAAQTEKSGLEESLPEDAPDQAVSEKALYYQALLVYGGVAAEREGREAVRSEISGLYFSGGWKQPSDLTPGQYYQWYLTMVWKMELSPQEMEERYSSPLGENRGWFFPADELEAAVAGYFDVPVEHLRSDPDVYSSQYGGYGIGSGGGIGAQPYVLLEDVRENGQERQLLLRLAYEENTGMEDSCWLLTIALIPDGGFRFLSFLQQESPAVEEESL